MCSASEMGSQGLGIQRLNQDLNFFEVPCVSSLDAARWSWRVAVAGDVASCSDVGF